ncbi:hypothetical protein [Desulfoscipio gibsoniae]
MSICKIKNRIKNKALKLKETVANAITNERGDLSIFTTKLGLAVVTVLVIAALIVVGPDTFRDLWDWFIAGLQKAFKF